MFAEKSGYQATKGLGLNILSREKIMLAGILFTPILQVTL